jgi:hypothetical protein
MRSLLNPAMALPFLFVSLPHGSSAAKGDDKSSGEKTLKLSFPTVNGWRLAPPRTYPSPGGYSVAYNTTTEDKCTVTVYVYNRGLACIPNDITSEPIRREIDGAKDAILQAKRLGVYEEVREEASKESTLGGGKDSPKALYARFRLRIMKQDLLSELYVLPYQNHFIKVRVTRSAQDAKKTQASLDRLYTALGRLLEKP